MVDKIYKLTKQELLRLTPDKKSEAISNIILQFLNKYPDGISISQMCREMDMTRNTITKHLEKLAALREVRKETKVFKEFGDARVAYFYPIGKVAEEKVFQKSGGKTTYLFSRIKNESGNFIYVREMEKDTLKGEQVKGAIIISDRNLRSFIEELHSFGAAGNQNEF